MDIEYSSTPKAQTIYTTVKLREDVQLHGGSVEVGCWVANSDSREACTDATKEEAIRLLRLALSFLES